MPLWFSLFLGFAAAVHAHILTGVWLNILGILPAIDRKIAYYTVPILGVITALFLIVASDTLLIIGFVFYATITAVTNIVHYIRSRKK